MGQFNGGLNTLADAAKLAPGEYALLVNGRTRRNVIDPTFAHLKITLPAQGNIQGLCGVGEQLFVMIAGVLYYANVGEDDINLRQVPNWTPMSATAEEVWMEPVPATSNLLKRVASSPESVSTSFDGSIARFRECIVVQDGLNTPRAVFPNLGWTSLGSYSTWTFDNPVYVPIGRQMAYSNGKLYVVSQDGKTIYHSVSGRPTDFVIAIDNNGNKAGDVDVTSIGVSYTELTALKASESGQLIATTLYGTWLLTPSDAITYWGEPYITPIEQFPVGATNQNAFADIIGDTAFLTQAGVQSFNVTRQAKIASNNMPLGAPISNVLTETQLPQAAATNFNDYGLFGVNTVYGPMTAVYDTMVGHYTSLDTSFGTAKFFARLLTASSQRLAFATDDNQLFLAHGDTSKVNVTGVYLGDFVAGEEQYSPGRAGKFLSVTGVKLSFVDVVAAGEINIKVYVDRLEVYNETRIVSVEEVSGAAQEQLPFESRTSTVPLSFVLPKAQTGWKVGVYVSWSFNGALSEVVVEGDKSERDSPYLEGTTSVSTVDTLGILGNIVFETRINPAFGQSEVGRPYDCRAGEWYLFNPQGYAITALDGTRELKKIGLFKSTGICKVYGDGIGDFTLRNVNQLKGLLDQMRLDGVTSLVGLGNYGYSSVEITEFQYMLSQQGISLVPTMGSMEYADQLGVPFKAATASYLPALVQFNNCVWAMYQTYDNALGYGVNSLQDKFITRELLASDKRFRFVAMHKSPYSSATGISPGVSSVRLDFAGKDVNSVFSASAAVAEYIRVGTVDYFTAGLSSETAGTFVLNPSNTPIWAYNEGPCYLRLTADAIMARIELRTSAGVTRQTRIIYG